MLQMGLFVFCRVVIRNSSGAHHLERTSRMSNEDVSLHLLYVKSGVKASFVDWMSLSINIVILWTCKTGCFFYCNLSSECLESYSPENETRVWDSNDRKIGECRRMMVETIHQKNKKQVIKEKTIAHAYYLTSRCSILKGKEGVKGRKQRRKRYWVSGPYIMQ